MGEKMQLTVTVCDRDNAETNADITYAADDGSATLLGDAFDRAQTHEFSVNAAYSRFTLRNPSTDSMCIKGLTFNGNAVDLLTAWQRPVVAPQPVQVRASHGPCLYTARRRPPRRVAPRSAEPRRTSTTSHRRLPDAVCGVAQGTTAFPPAAAPRRA